MLSETNYEYSSHRILTACYLLSNHSKSYLKTLKTSIIALGAHAAQKDKGLVLFTQANSASALLSRNNKIICLDFEAKDKQLHFSRSKVESPIFFPCELAEQETRTLSFPNLASAFEITISLLDLKVRKNTHALWTTLQKGRTTIFSHIPKLLDI